MVAPWNPTSAHYTTIKQSTNETIVMEARGVQVIFKEDTTQQSDRNRL